MTETFLVEEVKELTYDNEQLEEWKNKCNELGLENQLALADPDKSPIPFECMNTVQQRVYQTICPTSERYKDYGRTAIPLEVLSLIALAEKENYFDLIQIWYDDKAPDPIAVGIVGSEWSGRKYMLARWGHELKPFAALKEEAIARFKESTGIALRRAIATQTEKLTNLDNNVKAYFDGQIAQYEVTV